MASSYDVVIGYNVNDILFVEKLSAKLEKANMTVWYKKGDDTGKQTSEAILGCKIYLPVMTEDSAVDKNIQEQLSLAYISNSAIYPLSKIRFRYLSPKLNGGAKLMLAKINWCFVFDDEEFESKVDHLIVNMNKDLVNMRSKPGGGDCLSEAAFTHGLSFTHGMTVGEDTEEPGTMNLDNNPTTGFWVRNFSDRQEVTWSELKDKFLTDYKLWLDEQLPDMEEDKIEFIVNLIHKDIFNMQEKITKEAYDGFCESKDPHAFFSRSREYVVAYLSLREVLGMDSSLRISTIQSLGKFSFPAIVSGLSDMLKDEDANVRAVAAIALAHAGKDKEDTVDKLVGIIEDEDRIVRESACLSLGFLRSTRAVSYIVNRWRNDPISHVRQAAELALSKLDVQEAKYCMKVTQVLSKEMSSLKPNAQV